jgi:putative membrane protein
MNRITRFGYGAVAGMLAAACMTVIRTTARRRGIIEKTVPQAVEEWLSARTGLGSDSHPAVHHVADQVLHFGYGAALGSLYGLTVRGRTRTVLARGAGYGLATWLFGSWLVMPLMRAKQAAWKKRPSENAVDLLAHVTFGLATALVAEELNAQTDRGPSSDFHRRLVKIG